MLLVGAKNVREVTMFPMNQQAFDLVDGRAQPRLPAQLNEAECAGYTTQKRRVILV